MNLDPSHPADDALSDDVLDQVAGGEEVFDLDDEGKWGFRPWEPPPGT